MTAKILYTNEPTHDFPGVQYNTNKMENGRGELMQVSNFGVLQGLQNLRPDDYINYLKSIAALNPNIKEPQFHAVISAKGREHSKTELTQIAGKWLDAMGYGKQPYLIIYHQDTDNNHVHMVSLRVDKMGKTIPDSFEKTRAIQIINRIVGLSPEEELKKDLDKAMNYNFSTRAQFLLLLEQKGYKLKIEGTQIQIIKFGKKLADLPLNFIDSKIRTDQQPARTAQIKAIIDKYKAGYSPELKPVGLPLPGGAVKETKIQTSDLAEHLKDKLGIQMVFHAKDGKAVYGYTIIDHAQTNVFKGSEVMPLKELLMTQSPEQQKEQIESLAKKLPVGRAILEAEKPFYRNLVEAAMTRYPTVEQGLAAENLKLNGELIIDELAGTYMNIRELSLSAPDLAKDLLPDQQPEAATQVNLLDLIPQVGFAAEVDDNRLRKKNPGRSR
ncbi:relaxase/mobilization nuclease domain-containing protein [Mucilaginibacter lappiensis]|uniref:MobA/VirD2-like nuclease domain-containing protein n=1 Tax=Mucilaginibacter lappiensis TaxID=354630 RepID=A0A841JM51_9SPHI|nr:relaxase/mobilization nuclease domain-containing protein [Mucilaginibacter lappiensis]MBB6131524.1 hypothetical protein [Mucilaginibacter lappiensis]